MGILDYGYGVLDAQLCGMYRCMIAVTCITQIVVAPEADAFDLKSHFMGILRYATWWQANAGQTTSSPPILVIEFKQMIGIQRSLCGDERETNNL